MAVGSDKGYAKAGRREIIRIGQLGTAGYASFPSFRDGDWLGEERLYHWNERSAT